MVVNKGGVVMEHTKWETVYKKGSTMKKFISKFWVLRAD